MIRALPLLLLSLLGAGCSEYSVDARGVTDTWTQRPDTAVDWLFVVDDSCSMQPHQQRVGQHFDTLASALVAADIDVHIGVTTTDVPVDGGRLRDTVLTLDLPQVQERFRRTLEVGTEGSGFEMGLEASLRAVTGPARSTANNGFLRDQARLVVLYVSDEEDTSPRPIADVVRGLRESAGRTDRRAVSANALVVLDPETCDLPDFEGSAGTRYAAAARETGGLVLDLCAPDLAAPLARLSTEAAGLRDTFVLSDLPTWETLEVEIDGAPARCGEDYELVVEPRNGRERAGLRITPAPPVGTTLVARYRAGSQPPETPCAP